MTVMAVMGVVRVAVMVDRGDGGGEGGEDDGRVCVSTPVSKGSTLQFPLFTQGGSESHSIHCPDGGLRL